MTLSTYSSRVLSVPGYSASLFVSSLDAEDTLHTSFESTVQEVLLIPKRHIVTMERWNTIAEATLTVLEDDSFWNRVITTELGYAKRWREPVEDMLEYYRVETARNFEVIRQDHSALGYKALSSMMYQASEGAGLGYEYGIPAVIPFPQFFAILNDELIDLMETESDWHLGRDDLRVWRRVNSLVMASVSPEFKSSFSPLLRYDIPYGLSPEMKSETLEAIIKEARKVAVIPVLSGIGTASTALANQQWVVAIEAAAATGAVLIIMLGSVALADAMIHWMRRREIEGNRQDSQR